MRPMPMVRSSYFGPGEWLVIVLAALLSALLNIYLPVKAMTKAFGIPGPAAGMALLGGFIFVFWVCLGRILAGKKWAGLVTAVLIACICLLIRPWYGITSPPWFSIYGIISLFILGLCVELLRRREAVGGGLGNLLCLGTTWLAIGFHAHIWPKAEFVPLLLAASFISGAIGAILAREAGGLLRRSSTRGGRGG